MEWQNWIVCALHGLTITLIPFFTCSSALTFRQTPSTFAMFSPWYGCPNASISFEFKTQRRSSLLMYTDDKGLSDYVEIFLTGSRVRLRMNFASIKDDSIDITLGNDLSDNQWHHVEMQRDQMETTLRVDNQTDSQIPFGSDMSFGDAHTHNYVYFGGVPRSGGGQTVNGALSKPTAVSEPRFEGEIRNVVYGNCTCRPVRAVMIEGSGVSRLPHEACEDTDPCGPCLCVSKDDGVGCQCNGTQCTPGFYHLPMDTVVGSSLINPSGLDAEVVGHAQTVTGVIGHALQIDGRSQRVKVSGSDHRKECFGDLDLCPDGYTVGLWVQFRNTGTSQGVYVSNGGHSTKSHGIAMLYGAGKLTWVFRTKNGQEWRVTADDILTQRWYHVTVTWSRTEGLLLYVNGEKMDHVSNPETRLGQSVSTQYNDFVIGQPNDGSETRDHGIMIVDDFRFWSEKKRETFLREQGAIYHYHLPMDQLHEGHLVVPALEPRTIGKLRIGPGKIGKAIMIRGQGEHINLGSFSDTCLGNTSLCMYGFMTSFWISFGRLRNNTYYFSSGSAGFSVFSFGSTLFARVQRGDRKWQTSVPGLNTDRWYFVEVSWSATSGLELYVDQARVGTKLRSSRSKIKPSQHDNFYIGRANTAMVAERYAAAIIDDVHLYNADRGTLLAADIIQRGKPTEFYYPFDAMVGNRIVHPTTPIRTFGNPRLVPGKIGKALHLTGNQQRAEIDNQHGCLGNLDLCHHGVLLSFWFRPDALADGYQFISSGFNGITLSYADRKLFASAETSNRKWMVMKSFMQENKWHYLEVSWHPEVGLKLYNNNLLISENLTPEAKQDPSDINQGGRGKFILGNSDQDNAGSGHGGATYDEMEFWYGSRDYLLAFEYIQRGKPTSYKIKFDDIEQNGRRLVHKSLPIVLHGHPSLVPGNIRNALKLNGRQQYVDVGDQTDKCLGGIDQCRHGLTISIWLKIDGYRENMYILSTGNEGLRIYYRSGFLYAILNNKGQSWRVKVPQIETGVWRLVEISWHPDFGLNFYIDNELKDHADAQSVTESRGGSRNFYIGAANDGDVPGAGGNQGAGFTYGNMTVDDTEVWYSRREWLLAFDYIIREHGATILPGIVGNAVSLNGAGQYMDLGRHNDTCLSDLDLCHHGITISLWLDARNLRDGSYYLSSPSYSLYYKDGKLKSQFTSTGNTWQTGTNKFRQRKWTNVILSWEPVNGLVMYLDGKLVNTDTTPVNHIPGEQPPLKNVFVGKSNDRRKRSPAHALVDEVQFWYANIERLRAQKLYGGQLHEVIPLGQIGASGVLKLAERTISLQGGATRVRGQHFGAIKLNGKGQYIDFGDNLTCGGDLDNCPKGFTMRFSARPERLVNNMYFLDSFPISIFYRDGKLYATVRTPTMTWTVAAPGFMVGEWQVVDVSWHPEKGLTMYVNDEEAGAHKTHGTEIEPKHDWDTRTYFGRALTDMQHERYADTTVENFEIWNVRRDVVLSNNKLVSAVPGADSNPEPRVLPYTLPTVRPVQTTTPTIEPNDGRSVDEANT